MDATRRPLCRSLAFRCFLLPTLFAIATFLPTARVSAGDPALQTAVAILAQSGDDPAGDDALSKLERQVLNQIVFRHRLQQTALRRAVNELEAGRTVEGLACLQHVFDSREDGFLWTGSGPRLVSIRSEAARILSLLRPEARRTYEGIYGRQAQALLEEAFDQGKPTAVDEVARRFFHTSAGYRAADWQATRWLDHGRSDLAARRWRQLLADPSHRRRITDQQRLKLEFAERLAHTEDSMRPLSPPAGDEPENTSGIELAGGTVRPAASGVDRADWITNDPQRPAEVQVAYAPRQPSEFVRPLRHTTPYLKPLWTSSFLNEGDHDLCELVASWQKRQAQQLDPPAVANSALIVADMVVARNFQGIRASDADTGQLIWEFRCQSSLDAMVRRFNKLFGQSIQHPGRVGSQLSFQHAFACNSTIGTLTTDGQRVYAIDSLDLSYRPPSRHRGGDPQSIADPDISHDSNRLIALEVRPQEGQSQVAWAIGGGRTPENQGDLAGHFFLGPPLPVEDRLFAVTEAERQLNLVAIDPETGRMQWSQGIGFVELPIPEDPSRSSLACSPIYSQGVVVCPTQLGIVVGVDAVSGSLLWASYYGNAEAMRGFGRWPHTTHRTYGHAGFPDVPQVSGSKVVCLPRHSENVVCLDVHSGQWQWSVARRDGEYVAAIDDNTVMIVGRQFCRGLSLKTGAEVWSTRLTMPSGRGLASGGRYLVPLQEGRIATIEVASGREIGLTRPNLTTTLSIFEEPPAQYDRESLSDAFPETQWAPGNLLAYKDTIVSAGAQQIDVFPQSAALLVEVEAELGASAPSVEFQLLAAELQLAQGDFVGAKFRLAGVLAASLNETQCRRATTLLRDTLYRELEAGRGDEAAILDALDPLAQSADDRGRYLICRVESQLQRRDLSGLYASLHELADLELSEPLPTLRDPGHLLSPRGWVSDVVRRLPDYFSPIEIEELRLQVDAELQVAVAGGDLAEIKHFHATHAAWPESAKLRTELARQLIARGQFHQGELLLIQCRQSDDAQVVASATRQLVDLWSRLGLYQDAAELLRELGRRHGERVLEDGMTGSEFVATFPRTSPTWSAYLQMQPRTDTIHRIRISENRWLGDDERLEAAYSGYRRKLPTPHGHVFDLLEKGSGQNSTLAIVDKQSGVIVGNVDLPSPNQYPSPRRNAHVGHFIPIGSSAALNGVSLLERGDTQPLWTTSPAAPVYAEETLRVGPAGPTFCTFQSRQQFIVADPKNGDILWQRNDLESNSGMLGSTSYGLFGDDEVLVMFASDKSSYTVYWTDTGRIHSQGHLDIYSRHQPHTFGRRLFYLCETETGRRFRVWDPLKDRIVIDEPADGRVFSEPVSDEELIIVVQPEKPLEALGDKSEGRLFVFDVATGRRKFEVEFSPDELQQVNYLRAFQDGDRYYVNLQRAARRGSPRRYNYHATSSFVQTHDLQGDLYAIDRATGRRMWKRQIPQRSFVSTPEFRLPFLVAISNVRDPWNSRRKGLLVEAIDGATGETLGYKDNVLADRILQVSYDPQASAVRLHGFKTEVDLEFGPEIQRLAGLGESTAAVRP